MRPRNRQLHADIERACNLKEQLESPKEIAARHNTSPETIRVLISREMRRRKLTIVNTQNKLPCGKLER